MSIRLDALWSRQIGTKNTSTHFDRTVLNDKPKMQLCNQPIIIIIITTIANNEELIDPSRGADNAKWSFDSIDCVYFTFHFYFYYYVIRSYTHTCKHTFVLGPVGTK
jgi:hypothetical protein